MSTGEPDDARNDASSCSFSALSSATASTSCSSAIAMFSDSCFLRSMISSLASNWFNLLTASARIILYIALRSPVVDLRADSSCTLLASASDWISATARTSISSYISLSVVTSCFTASCSEARFDLTLMRSASNCARS